MEPFIVNVKRGGIYFIGDVEDVRALYDSDSINGRVLSTFATSGERINCFLVFLVKRNLDVHVKIMHKGKGKYIKVNAVFFIFNGNADISVKVDAQEMEEVHIRKVEFLYGVGNVSFSYEPKNAVYEHTITKPPEEIKDALYNDYLSYVMQDEE